MTVLGLGESDDAQRSLGPLGLALDVAARIGPRVVTLGALRRHPAHSVGTALPALLALLNHGLILPLYFAPAKPFPIKGLFDVRNS
jgi:hypothetical protein